MEKTPSEEIQWEVHKFPITVIAENIHSPSNIGMIIRLCEAFGVREVHFTGPFSNQTKKYKKSARSAENYINVYKNEDTISVLQSMKARQFQTIGIEICKNGSALQNYKFPKRDICLVLGSERHGIDPLTLKLLDHCVQIRQFGELGSINAAMALSIALYEATKQITINLN